MKPPKQNSGHLASGLLEPFIKRPIGTSLLAVIIALCGIISFNLLPVSQLPQVEFPTIFVQAQLPGASPEIMATSVATPLERQLGRIAHVTQMTSQSTMGKTGITIQFDLDRDIDGAARDVQAAIVASLSQLPSNLIGNPTYRKVNPADAPILILGLTSDIYKQSEIYDAASTILQQKLSQIEGVGQVIVGGSSLPALRVEFNPTALNQYQIGLNTLQDALANANVNTPKGGISTQDTASILSINDQIFAPKDYENLIISYRGGSPVRVSDVAKVENSVEDVRNFGLTDNKQSVLLVIFKQPGANVIESVDRVLNVLPQLKASIPAAINLTVAMERTSTIKASLRDVEFTLLVAILLVVLVVYLFLQDFQATIIPSIAVPLSLLGTFGVMYLLDYSLDNLSLMALTISTGFVVDDAIVVLENITRHREAGLSILRAAILGVKEVSFTVFSISVSLIAVFIPILLMGGIVGRLFQEFSITLSIAILVSLLVSLTITPMMCSVILKDKKHKKTKDKIEDKIDNLGKSEKDNRRITLSQRLLNQYKKTLLWAFRHQKLMFAIFIGTLVLNVYLFVIAPKGFFPQQDTGRIMATLQADQDISFSAMREKFKEFSAAIQKDPAVQHVVGFVGQGTTNTGSLFITLKPLEERKVSAEQVIVRIRKSLKEKKGAVLYMQATQDLVIGSRMAKSQFQYTLSADNIPDLNEWVEKIESKLKQIPGIVDPNSDALNNGLESRIKINHGDAVRLGLTSQQIDTTLYNAFGQSRVSTLYTPMNQYHVVMVVDSRYWQDPKSLNQIYITPVGGGAPVPLTTFAKFTKNKTLLAVNHQGQFPATTISFNILPTVALGDIVEKVEMAVQELKLPPNILASFQGAAKAFQASLASEPYLILTALLAVYIVLGILYESLIHPITILSTLPSAGIGALIALRFFDTDLSIIALIGMILLIGIVKKNAIMMIDFAIQLRRNENVAPQIAIYRACLLRFRPIMMTTMAALLGAVPLAFDGGVGSELRRPLGISIVGGLIVSQMLTLYTTPIIYLFLERLSDNWRQRQRVV